MSQNKKRHDLERTQAVPIIPPGALPRATGDGSTESMTAVLRRLDEAELSLEHFDGEDGSGFNPYGGS